MNKNKVAALLLSSISLISLVSCSANGNSTIPDINIDGYISDSEEHLVDNGLHNVNIKDVNRKFITNKSSEYIIVGSDNSFVSTAIGFINKHLKSASGISLNVNNEIDVDSWNEKSKWIVIGRDDIMEKAGVQKTTEKLDYSGFQITSKGESVFISCKRNQGYQYAAIHFLNYVIGMETFSPEITTYKNAAEYLPDFDVVEKNDIDLPVPSAWLDQQTSYAYGMTPNSDVFVQGTVGEKRINAFHNALDYLSPSKYAENHPDWFAPARTQLCYTAHGNKEEYELMQEEIMKTLRLAVDLYKDAPAVSLTICDNYEQCSCDECSKYINKYGCDSASVICFMNDLGEKLDNYLTQKAEAENKEKRNIDLLFFAYHKCEGAPVKKDENGKFVPIDEKVICRDNIGVYLAPIGSYFSHSLYEDENEYARELIDQWSSLSNKIYMWIYDLNTHYYLYPYNTFDSRMETYRYLKSHNALYCYNQSQWNAYNTTAFSRFKEYVNSIAYYNVNTSYSYLIDNYFTNYFKSAKEPMLTYFHELQAYMRYLEETYPDIINGTIDEEISNSKFWPKKLLERWLNLMQDAYNSIEKYKSSDPNMYQILSDNICIETIFPRMAIIDLYAGYYTKEEFNKIVNDMIHDTDRLRFNRYNEAATQPLSEYLLTKML